MSDQVGNQKVGFLMTRLICFLTASTVESLVSISKVPKFSDTRKLCCNLPKIQEKMPNLWVFRQKDANGIANSGDPVQTAPLGAV